VPKILHFFHTLESGGAQAMRLSIIKALLNANFVHEIISLRGGPLLQDALALGIKVTVVRGFGPRLFSLPQILGLVKIFNPDIIHSLPWVPNFFSRTVLKFFFPSAKIICDFHGTAHMGLVQHCLDKYSFELADRWLFVSQDLLSYFCAKWGVLFASEKFVVLPNFIDQRIFQYSGSACKVAKKGAKEDIFVLGIAARLEPVKRLHMLLEYFAYLKDQFLGQQNLRLIIAGAGPLDQELRKLALRLGIADFVAFENLSREQMPNFYNVLDAFVLCSESEGQPLVLMEAAAAGVPIVLSRNLFAQAALFLPGAPVSYFSDQQEFTASFFEIMQNKRQYANYLRPCYFTENAVEVYAKLYKSFP
jgi:glycosyltransferase involved in cell wall biosynthesis